MLSFISVHRGGQHLASYLNNFGQASLKHFQDPANKHETYGEHIISDDSYKHDRLLHNWFSHTFGQDKNNQPVFPIDAIKRVKSAQNPTSKTVRE